MYSYLILSRVLISLLIVLYTFFSFCNVNTAFQIIRMSPIFMQFIKAHIFHKKKNAKIKILLSFITSIENKKPFSMTKLWNTYFLTRFCHFQSFFLICDQLCLCLIMCVTRVLSHMYVFAKFILALSISPKYIIHN